jgi:hypothetical protein
MIKPNNTTYRKLALSAAIVWCTPLFAQQLEEWPIKQSTLPTEFTCDATHRFGNVHLRGTLHVGKRWYLLDIQVVNPTPDLSLRRVAEMEQERVYIEAWNGATLLLNATVGRRTITLEIDAANTGRSFLDDGTVYFWHQISCSTIAAN